MTDFPASALSLAGFALAHAAWSVSDTTDDDLLCPIAFLEQSDGNRRLVRFEADSQEQAIALGKDAMRTPEPGTMAWAFAREGAWRPKDLDEAQDVLSVDFWGSAMQKPATIVQPFERYTKRGRFRLLGNPVLIVNGQIVDDPRALEPLDAIQAGVLLHPHVSDLWPTWRRPHASRP